MRILEIYAKYTIAYILFFAQCYIVRDTIAIAVPVHGSRSVHGLGVRKVMLHSRFVKLCGTNGGVAVEVRAQTSISLYNCQ